jgi:hypothetical protein
LAQQRCAAVLLVTILAAWIVFAPQKVGDQAGTMIVNSNGKE